MTFPMFGCTLSRIQYVNCVVPTNYSPYFWWSRFPQEKSSFWNLIKLFTPGAWSFIFLSLTLTVVCMSLFTYIGKKMGMKSRTLEIILNPFRSVLFSCKEAALLEVLIYVYLSYCARQVEILVCRKVPKVCLSICSFLFNFVFLTQKEDSKGF